MRSRGSAFSRDGRVAGPTRLKALRQVTVWVLHTRPRTELRDVYESPPAREGWGERKTGAQGWAALSFRSPTMIVKAGFDSQFFKAPSLLPSIQPLQLHCAGRLGANIRYSSPPTLMA